MLSDLFVNFNVHRIVDYWRQHTTARIVRQYSLANIINYPRKETNETRLKFPAWRDPASTSYIRRSASNGQSWRHCQCTTIATTRRNLLKLTI